MALGSALVKDLEAQACCLSARQRRVTDGTRPGCRRHLVVRRPELSFPVPTALTRKEAIRIQPDTARWSRKRSGGVSHGRDVLGRPRSSPRPSVRQRIAMCDDGIVRANPGNDVIKDDRWPCACATPLDTPHTPPLPRADDPPRRVGAAEEDAPTDSRSTRRAGADVWALGHNSNAAKGARV